MSVGAFTAIQPALFDIAQSLYTAAIDLGGVNTMTPYSTMVAAPFDTQQELLVKIAYWSEQIADNSGGGGGSFDIASLGAITPPIVDANLFAVSVSGTMKKATAQDVANYVGLNMPLIQMGNALALTSFTNDWGYSGPILIQQFIVDDGDPNQFSLRCCVGQTANPAINGADFMVHGTLGSIEVYAAGDTSGTGPLFHFFGSNATSYLSLLGGSDQPFLRIYPNGGIDGTLSMISSLSSVSTGNLLEIQNNHIGFCNIGFAGGIGAGPYSLGDTSTHFWGPDSRGIFVYRKIDDVADTQPAQIWAGAINNPTNYNQGCEVGLVATETSAKVSGSDYTHNRSFAIDTEQFLVINGNPVMGPRVVDARVDDTINTVAWDATTAGVLDAIRDAAITQGWIAAA